MFIFTSVRPTCALQNWIDKSIWYHACNYSLNICIIIIIIFHFDLFLSLPVWDFRNLKKDDHFCCGLRTLSVPLRFNDMPIAAAFEIGFYLVCLWILFPKFVFAREKEIFLFGSRKQTMSQTFGNEIRSAQIIDCPRFRFQLWRLSANVLAISWWVSDCRVCECRGHIFEEKSVLWGWKLKLGGWTPIVLSSRLANWWMGSGWAINSLSVTKFVLHRKEELEIRQTRRQSERRMGETAALHSYLVWGSSFGMEQRNGDIFALMKPESCGAYNVKDQAFTTLVHAHTHISAASLITHANSFISCSPPFELVLLVTHYQNRMLKWTSSSVIFFDIVSFDCDRRPLSIFFCIIVVYASWIFWDVWLIDVLKSLLQELHPIT